MNVYRPLNIQRVDRVSRVEHEQQTRLREANKPTTHETQGTDTVRLSDEAKIYAAIQQRLAEVPPVRTEKVEALKAAIQSGNYHVPAERIAEAMLKEGKNLAE